MHLSQLGDIAGDAVVEREPFPVTELHDRDRGECLGDRAPVKDGSLVHALAQHAIRKAVLVVRQDPAVAHHQHARAHDAVAGGIGVEPTGKRLPSGRRVHA